MSRARAGAAPRPARILIVSAYLAPHVGGVEVIAARQAGLLAAAGHQVTVITSRTGRTSRGAPAGQVSGPAAGPADGPAAGYRVIRVPAWNGLEGRLGLPLPVWSPGALWRLARLVRGADRVHVHDAYHPGCILAALAAAWYRRPLSATQHVAEVDHAPWARWAQRAAWRLAGRLVWSRADTVTCYNSLVAGFLRGHGVAAGKIIEVGNGVDTDFFSPAAGPDGPAGRDGTVRAAVRARHGLDQDLPVVLFAGRLVPKKGAAALLGAAGPGYQIALAGPGAMPGPVPPGVRFLGPLTRSELRDLYRASDIFACPSAGETFTLAMQEAMACGLPVVATGGAAYAGSGLDPAGVALVQRGPAALRAAFTAILADPARRAAMAAYSRALARERFDWRRHAVAAGAAGTAGAPLTAGAAGAAGRGPGRTGAGSRPARTGAGC